MYCTLYVLSGNNGRRKSYQADYLVSLIALIQSCSQEIYLHLQLQCDVVTHKFQFIEVIDNIKTNFPINKNHRIQDVW